MKTRLVLFLLMAAFISGCGTENATPDQTAADTETAPASPPAASTEAPAPAPAPAKSAMDDEPEVAAIDDARSSDDAVKAPAAAPPTSKYSAGKHYSQLTSAQGTSGGPGGIEVTEVFWYGCPHCFSFDPIITRWEGEQSGDVRFVRLPVMWNPTNEIHARMYYTAEALDKLDEMHEAFFTAMHRDGKTLTSEADIKAVFERFGVSSEKFDETFRSFTVESKMKRARDLTARYRIRSVPVVVVDGKYIVDGPEVKSYGDMLAVTDELVAKERALR